MSLSQDKIEKCLLTLAHAIERGRIDEIVLDIKEILYMRCEHCGVVSANVQERENRYSQDVANILYAKHVACDYCDEQRAAGI